MVTPLFILGLALVALGLVLVPLPGPGWLLVAVGLLAMLAAGVVRLLLTRAANRR